jgi:hypothetical protein
MSVGPSDIDLSQSAASAAAAAIEADGGSAPGTEGTPAPQTQSSQPAEASTTEMGTESSTPDSVPYSRFKEVNDQLRPWKEFQEFGHDANSLRQLVEWERSFNLDPAASWMSVAEQIEQLPQNVRDAVMMNLQAQGSQNPSPNASEGETTPTGEEPPEWARPLIEDYQSRTEREEQKANDQALESMLDWWTEQDKSDGIQSPDKKYMLTFISGNSGEADSLEDLQQRARNEWKELREAELRASVDTSRGGAPLPVPGGGPASNPPPKPSTLSEASRRAIADIRSGVLKAPEGMSLDS